MFKGLMETMLKELKESVTCLMKWKMSEKT